MTCDLKNLKNFRDYWLAIYVIDLQLDWLATWLTHDFIDWRLDWFVIWLTWDLIDVIDSWLHWLVIWLTCALIIDSQHVIYDLTHNLIDLRHDWLSRLVWLTIWLTRNLIDWQLRWIRWFTTRLTCNLINSIDSPTESLTTWLTFDLIDFWLDWLVTWLTSDLIHLLFERLTNWTRNQAKHQKCNDTIMHYCHSPKVSVKSFHFIYRAKLLHVNREEFSWLSFDKQCR